MIVKIDNLSQFNNSFLSLISKVCDNICIKIDEKKIYSITSSGDNTIVVLSTYAQNNTGVNPQKLNIPDITRFSRVMSCIDKPDAVVDVDNNCIKYKSPTVRFKYHLLEDGIISTPGVSMDKIKNLSFKHSFDIDKQTILSLIKGSSLVTDIDKLYFFVEDGDVYAEITDRETSNVDSYTQKISNGYTGDGVFDQMVINFEILRMVSSLRFDKIRIKINTDVNVLIFEVEIDKTKHNFICTTYVR